MNCGEAREYLFAFLDNELETSLSIELQRHLDECADCAREAEIERTIHKSLSHGVIVPALDCPESLAELQIGIKDEASNLSAETFRSPRSNRRNAIRWNLARPTAGVIVLIGIALWYGFDADRTVNTPAALVTLAIDDFEHFLEDGGSLQIEGQNRLQVARWLEGKTGLPVELPRPMDADMRLLGGRKCKLDGRPAAFAVYQINDALASLVAVEITDAALRGMQHVNHAGERMLVGRRGKYSVAARRRGSLVYAAVSTLPDNELLRLLTESFYESH